MVEGFDGNCRGLAPLAVAAEDEVFGGGIEDLGLFGFGVEVEGGFGPFAGYGWAHRGCPRWRGERAMEVLEHFQAAFRGAGGRPSSTLMPLATLSAGRRTILWLGNSRR